MCKPRLIAVSAMLLVMACIVFARSSNPGLPPGPMQAKVATACTECHEARIILQQRLGKAAWTKEVDKMIKWGAVVDPQDHDAFVDYWQDAVTLSGPQQRLLSKILDSELIRMRISNMENNDPNMSVREFSDTKNWLLKVFNDVE